MSPPLGALRTAVSEKLAGEGPGRMRALVAAVATGATTAVLTYRLLRSGQ